MEISCAFATSPATPRHVAIAEDLGYRRAWSYDSPALYPDVWMTLALAAAFTIGWRSDGTSTPGPSPIFDVCPAASAKVIHTSGYSAGES